MARSTPRWEPPAETLSHFPDISGNTVNGLGEAERRAPSPFFWHDPSVQTHGELQKYVVSRFYDSAEVAEAFSRDPETLQLRPRGPDPIPVAPERVERSAAEWTEIVKTFALANEADLVGIARRNFIREQGWPSESFPGPRADALLMIPAAIAAGLGELGKHGSMINRTHGASFRLSAVSTDVPLIADEPDVFGADDFCHNFRLCTDACPPDAIAEQKQLVRGDEKWFVDFDRCIPYFAETKGCAICIARCPWSRPGVADNLLVKMAARRERHAAAGS